jgi:hypothetical protein
MQVILFCIGAALLLVGQFLIGFVTLLAAFSLFWTGSKPKGSRPDASGRVS